MCVCVCACVCVCVCVLLKNNPESYYSHVSKD